MIEFLQKTYKGSKIDLINHLKETLDNETKCHIVTANPEILMYGKREQVYGELLLNDETIIVPDGIGVVKAIEQMGMPIIERIPGVELSESLLELANQTQLTVYFYGSKKDVLESLNRKFKEKYKNLQIVGMRDGYTQDETAVFEDIKNCRPDIIFVALGVPAQEYAIRRHLDDMEKGVFIGVGGALDVLSGSKKRAPEFFIKHNLEWFYRIFREPKRLKRFFNNNIKFYFQLKQTRSNHK